RGRRRSGTGRRGAASRWTRSATTSRARGALRKRPGRSAGTSGCGWGEARRIRGMAVRDAFARPLRNLRISVTDPCNLRCSYCMPERDYAWLARKDILDFEEIARLTGVFAGLGVTRVRLTGGEPLVRRDLPRLVRLLAADARLTDLALTTNGVLLAEQARPL